MKNWEEATSKMDETNACFGIRKIFPAGLGLLFATTVAFGVAHDTSLSVSVASTNIDQHSTSGLNVAAFANAGGSEILTPFSAAQLIDWPNNSEQISHGIKIGMIDGGVNKNHPALHNQDITTREFTANGATPVQLDHGTAVASLLVGNPSTGDLRGLLPNATLFAANIFSQDRNGRIIGDPMAFSNAIDWLIDMDVSVINVSLTGKTNGHMERAINKAVEHGILVVAAAGNNRGNSGRDYPGAYRNVLAATAVDADLNIYAYASLGSHVDFAAPGVSLRMASNSGSEVLSGTSFAAPFLTATVALSLRDQGAINASTIRTRLSNTARDLGRAGLDQVFGYGLLDATSNEGLVAQVDRRPSRVTPIGARRLTAN